MKKVLLICMPYGALERPALGLSLLKPVLAGLGIPCDVHYLNFTLADLLGHERYRWISSELPYTAFAGDWTFTDLLYGKRPGAEEAYVEEILRRLWCRSEADIRAVLDTRSLAARFLEHCLAAIPWRDYRVVGFTSTFEQNIASLALGRQIKRYSPDTAIVFGGANWEGDMGLELHRRFRFVDYVCSGESEASFPALVERIFGGSSVHDVAGIVYRSNGESVSTGAPQIVREMDQLPVPDFSDYFRDFGNSAAATGLIPTLLGLPVFLSDRVTINVVSAINQYHTYLVGRGALALFYQRQVMVEFDRDILKKTDLISADIHFASHLFGYDDQGAAVVAEQNKSIHAVSVNSK